MLNTVSLTEIQEVISKLRNNEYEAGRRAKVSKDIDTCNFHFSRADAMTLVLNVLKNRYRDV